MEESDCTILDERQFNELMGKLFPSLKEKGNFIYMKRPDSKTNLYGWSPNFYKPSADESLAVYKRYSPPVEAASSSIELSSLAKLLSDKDTYDIVSAIRGPDGYFPYLKMVFTARLRALVGLDGGMCDLRTQRLSEASVRGAAEEAKNVSSHYLAHLSYAFNAIQPKLGITERKEAQSLLKLIYTMESNDIASEVIADARSLGLIDEGS